MFSLNKSIIAVLHLPPMPGFQGHLGMNRTIEFTIREALKLEDGGVDGILLENENDKPHEVQPGPEVVSAMTVIACAVKRELKRTRLGGQILLNDPKGALAICQASGGEFIRTDYFVDRMSRAEHGGEIKIDPKGLMAYRKRIGAEGVKIFADIQVKYAQMLEPRPLEVSARLAEEAGADGILVTSDRTGEAPRIQDILDAKKGAPRTPVLVGSGLDARNARKILEIADGAFVGTAFKVGEEISLGKVREIISITRSFG